MGDDFFSSCGMISVAALENLHLSVTDISDISFLERNKNIKELNLERCQKIKDYSFISKLEKLENLSAATEIIPHELKKSSPMLKKSSPMLKKSSNIC